MGGREVIAINTESHSTFDKGGNAARTLIHELMHDEWRDVPLSSSGHHELDDVARSRLKKFGLGDGGCEAVGGFFFGLFGGYPACDRVASS